MLSLNMKRLLLIAALLPLVPFSVKAQSPSVTPVHGWLLGPATLNTSGKETCILFNQFSDGSGLRFNIRDEKVETITVIYRQDIFNPTLTNFVVVRSVDAVAESGIHRDNERERRAARVGVDARAVVQLECWSGCCEAP